MYIYLYQVAFSQCTYLLNKHPYINYKHLMLLVCGNNCLTSSGSIIYDSLSVLMMSYLINIIARDNLDILIHLHVIGISHHELFNTFIGSYKGHITHFHNRCEIQQIRHQNH